MSAIPGFRYSLAFAAGNRNRDVSIRSRAKRALASLAFYRSRLVPRRFPGVAVLAYHGVRDDGWARGTMRFEPLHVTASQLDAHCRMLRALGCTVISPAEWMDIASGRREPPPRAVLLTFDDGYRSVLTQALPILERHEMPAAVFVCSGPVERQVRFWFDALAERHGEEAVEQAKALEYATWRARVSTCETAATPGDPHAPLTVDELRRLAAHPLVTIGAHTVSHPILSRAPIDVQRHEIDGCRAALEAWIGYSPVTFAYPNGRPRIDYTAETADVLASCGFRCAFSTDTAFATPVAAPYEVPRFLMLDSVDAAELAHRLAVAWPQAAGAPS